MQKIPITFIHQGKTYSGTLDAVQGGGGTWHLMINKFYCGRLRFTGKWVFDPTPRTEGFRELAGEFGEWVKASCNT